MEKHIIIYILLIILIIVNVMILYKLNNKKEGYNVFNSPKDAMNFAITDYLREQKADKYLAEI